jgi:hypothetical protein
VSPLGAVLKVDGLMAKLNNGVGDIYSIPMAGDCCGDFCGLQGYFRKLSIIKGDYLFSLKYNYIEKISLKRKIL